MESLIFNEEVICNKLNYKSEYDKTTLLEKIFEIISKSPKVTNDGYYISNEYISYFKDILKCGIQACKKLIQEKNETHDDVMVEYWVNRVNKNTKNQVQLTTIQNPVFHSHAEINKKRQIAIPDYTFVYYIQVQDNLSNNEGHLLMKNKKDEIFSYLPEENDLIIMDGDLYHSPVPASQSTKDRLVLACNVKFIKTQNN